MVEESPTKRIPIVFILIDGLADYQNKFDGDEDKTTLEKAQTPVMDALAS